jgi:hypothetical protein
MTRAWAIGAAMAFGVIAGAVPALADQQLYTYAVIHPFYGKIGTLTDTIDRTPEGTRIHASLRIAVDVLGIVVYREESDITEVLHGNRLVSLQSVTERDDGRHVEVHGEAQGDRFVVYTTAGSFTAPASTAPSDPWVLKHTGEGTMVYPDTGIIVGVRISGGGYDTISVNGASISARHFVVMADKRQDVWLDDREIPVMFRTIESGTQIDLVLQDPTTQVGANTAAAVRLPALARLADGGK